MYFKITVICIALLAIISVNTAPVTDQPQNPTATILKYSYKPNENNDGGYRLEYRTSDGESRIETARVIYVGENKVPVLFVNGEYSYVGPDGVKYQARYIADENGFKVNREIDPTVIWPGVSTELGDRFINGGPFYIPGPDERTCYGELPNQPNNIGGLPVKVISTSIGPDGKIQKVRFSLCGAVPPVGIDSNAIKSLLG